MDAARALAACYVVVHHLAKAHGFSHGPGLIFRFGQEAVIVFFLLSGFVIFANERERALRPRGYLLRRLRRIYPPLIAAIAVATLVALLDGTLARDFHASELWGTVLSLQDISVLKPGVIANSYLGNDPLWSLSYEVLFYIAFPAVLLAWTRRPRLTTHLVGASCCLSYAGFALAPNHFLLVAAYFLIWWSGAMAARAYLDGARNVGGMIPTFAWLLALCAVAAAVLLFVPYRGPGLYPALPLRHFAVAALMLALLFGPAGRILARLSWRVSGVAAAVASISYGLYVLHYPVLVSWSFAQSPLGFGVAALVVVVLAYLVERQLPKVLPRAPRD